MEFCCSLSPSLQSARLEEVSSHCHYPFFAHQFNFLQPQCNLIFQPHSIVLVEGNSIPEVGVDTKLTLPIKDRSVINQADYCDKSEDERVAPSCYDVPELLPRMPDDKERDGMVMTESDDEDDCDDGEWVSVADDDINPLIHDNDNRDFGGDNPHNVEDYTYFDNITIIPY